MKWVKDKVKALGVWFSTDPKVTMEANYSDRLAKVNECLCSWEYRHLSLLGNITVLKSLIASKLVYILSPLPTNYHVLKDLSKSFFLAASISFCYLQCQVCHYCNMCKFNKVVFHFLWSGKGDKIKRNVMIGDYSDGGLKMIDLESFNKALKSTWVKKYLDLENMVNGSTFLTLNCNILVGLPSLEATSNKTTCQNTAFWISSLWKFCKSGQK